MQLKKVKPGTLYVVKGGAIGRCDGPFNKTHVKMTMLWPFPRQGVTAGREIEREATRFDVPEQIRDKLFPVADE